MGDRWTLELLLTAAPWISGNRTAEDKYLSTYIGALEMLMKGCTACYDLTVEFPQPTPEGLGACAKAYADAGMREGGAPGRTRQSPRPPPRDCKRHAKKAGALGEIAECAGNDPHGEPDRQRRKGAAAMGPCEQHGDCDQRGNAGGDQPLCCADEVTAFPGE